MLIYIPSCQNRRKKSDETSVPCKPSQTPNTNPSQHAAGEMDSMGVCTLGLRQNEAHSSAQPLYGAIELLIGQIN